MPALCPRPGGRRVSDLLYSDPDRFDEAAEQTAVTVVDRVLARAVSEGASDIHLESTFDSFRVRFRVDGTFREIATFAPQLALFKQLYFKVLKPRGIVKARPVQDRPEPHNFAQGLGGVFLAVASVFLIPLPVVGLALSLLVAVLAFVNLAFGYCLGCQIYFQLGKRGLIRA